MQTSNNIQLVMHVDLLCTWSCYNVKYFKLLMMNALSLISRVVYWLDVCQAFPEKGGELRSNHLGGDVVTHTHTHIHTHTHTHTTLYIWMTCCIDLGENF